MSDIPAPLQSERRWIVWAHKDGRKPPVGLDGSPNSKWNSPESWLTYEEAVNAFQASSHIDGIGFVLGGGWGGVDLDKCRSVETGEIHPSALAVIDACDAYTEISPSSTGLKIFGKADKWMELTFYDGTTKVEVKDRGYFAVTGIVHHNGSALTELPLDAIAAQFGTAGVTNIQKKKRELEERIRPGGQNTALFKEACMHARHGKSETEIFALIRAIATERCEQEEGREPWDDAAIRAIARSASRYAPNPDPCPLTEQGDAEFFEQLHKGLVHYDHRQSRWLIYDGFRWAPDQVENIRNLAIESMRSRLQAGLQLLDNDQKNKHVKHAVGGESVTRINHMLTAARALPEISSSGMEFDTDPWLLGVTNGVVNLRTGTLRQAAPDDMLTMQTAVPYNPDAKCPLWERTVKDVFKDNPDIVPYIQRAFGYSLTGKCDEEVFFLLVGTGRNGKGTLVNTFSAILGDYADNLSFSSLEASKHGQAGGAASPDIAKLVNKRFVSASETTDGRQINEARIKTITGRDPITARFLYGKEFTFEPDFKLWLSVNHLPRVHDDSAGFWSRPHQVPFEQSYEGREDRTLKDRLIDEAEGILAWAVRGALEWQEKGLAPPHVCTKAKQEYRLSQEPLNQFYEDECVLDPKAKVKTHELFQAYNEWFDRNRFRGRKLGRNSFNLEVAKRVGPHTRSNGARWFSGIGVARHELEDDGQVEL